MLWTVSELNRYVHQLLDIDYRLQDLRITGEISGFKSYNSGHWYFTLKDAYAQINCVMWRSKAERQHFVPRDGDAVLAMGKVGLYEVRGQFQLEVTLLQPTGEGELYRRFIYLKASLEAEGLFSAERKRPMPAWPRRIGIVTSPSGAALRDILTVIRRRWSLVDVIIAPTPVQGDDAPPQIVAALQAVCDYKPDVIILARGGGSLEDLWCFNHELVARAVAASPVPVICGVGHETDFTIADFAADLRAATPSAAAELVTRDGQQLATDLGETQRQLAEAMRQIVRAKRWELQSRQAELRSRSPEAKLRTAQQRLDDASLRLGVTVQHRLAMARERWRGLQLSLSAVSPLAVLERGYALVSLADGSVVRQPSQVAPGDALRVRVAGGEFGAAVPHAESGN
jgi:exodeoxyribonuclease VII large subunit